MPMLGKKLFHLIKSPTDIRTGEEIYTIPHTQEKFRSKDEYEKRLEFYKERIWTCRCTGHATLTHEEAWNSEKVVLKNVKTAFPEVFEKPVLEIVHHSTESLENLVDQSWTKFHHILVPGEIVTLKYSAGSEVTKGTVVSISSSSELSGATNCNSPSSDKENSSDEKDTSPKKWTPPKLLPHKYTVKLEKGPIVNSIPVQDLMRSDRPPSKELLRLFIRAFSIRAGVSASSPWIVNEDLVKKYALPSKFADFLLVPSKMAEAAKRAEDVTKKRKHQGQDKTASKMQKLSGSIKKLKDKLKPISQNKTVKASLNKTVKTNLNKSVKKKNDKEKDCTPRKKSTPHKSPKEVIEINDSSDEEVSLAKIKMKCASQSQDSDSDIPLASIAEQSTPKFKKKSLGNNAVLSDKKTVKKSISPNKKLNLEKKRTPKKTVDNHKTPTKRKRHNSDDSDVPLCKLAVSKQTSTTSRLKTPSKKMKELNEQTPSKKIASCSEKSSEKGGKHLNKKGNEKISAAGQTSNKSMKQMTLLDMTSKKEVKPPVTPRKTPEKPSTPLIVRKLMRLDKDEDRLKFNLLLKKAVMVLTAQQKESLPPPIKDKLYKKMERMEEKTKLENMTEAEREDYMKQKKEKQKQKMKEKLKARMKELRQRFEERDLVLKDLPAPKLVPTPDGLPNELFGDVTMVTEFISSYSGLLMPDSQYPIYTDALMKALAGGPQGFAYLSRVLGVLLQTLLQDEIAEDYSELNVSLSDVAVNPYTASEMVRLCLRRNDASEDSSEGGETDAEVPDSIIQQLETQEFFQLECAEKLAVLRGLCLRVLATYSVQDYMEEKQREAIQLTKQRVTEMKGYQEKMKDKKSKVDEKQNTSLSVNGDTSRENSPAVTITSFYGKKMDDSANDSAVDSQEENGNLISIIKRRRFLAAKALAEKEQREKERRLQREKEYEEERSRKEREQFETKYKDSIALARTVLRHTPIGYDRHHNRYWVFTSTTPGLYIEKGWVSQDINYNPGEAGKKDDNSTFAASSPEKSTSTPKKQRLNLKKKKALVESSVPRFGQNLWFTYSSVKDFDGLIKSLHPQGIREGALKAELKKRHAEITKAIVAAQRGNLELRDSDGNVEILAGFKKELSEMELKLRNGGLGGVLNYATWEAKLMASDDIPALGSCLLEVQAGILEKFLEGFMKIPKSSTAEGDTESEVKEEDDKEVVETKEDKKVAAAIQRLQQWKSAVENCSTMSRLHVLLSMMDSCIKWEKSAEKAKCKICRRKCDDDRLLLCDECNQAFHMYCLRPALIHVPRGDWFCPACVPQSKRRKQAPKRFADESSADEEEDEDKGSVEHKTTCEECGGDDDELIACSKCPAIYHLTCHQPPLRRSPRGPWQCDNCKNGKTRQKKKRPQRKGTSRKNYRDEESTDEDSDSAVPSTSRSTSNRRSGSTSTGSTPTSSSRSSRNRHGERYDELIQRSRRAPSELSLCEDILHRLMKHKSCWPFIEPVDKKEVPDYYQIIRRPMDFQTMLKKCTRLSYSSPQEFVEDALLVFSNAATYNQPNSEVYQCMREIEKFFGDLLTKYLPEYASSQIFVSETGDDSTTNARLRRSQRN